MKRLSPQKRKQVLSVLGLSAVVMVGLWFGLINAQSQKLRALTERKEASARKLEQINKAVQNGPLVEAQLGKEGARLDEFEADMASGDLNSWAFNTIRHFKARYDIDIPQFGRIDGPKDSNLLPRFPYKQASVTIAGTAHFRDLGSFVADFENKFPYFRVANLTIEPTAAGSVGNDPERLAFKMDIIALVKPNQS